MCCAPKRALFRWARATTAVTHGRYKFITVSLLKRFRNGRFTSLVPRCGGFRSETAAWIQKWFKIPLGLLESQSQRLNLVPAPLASNGDTDFASRF
jgi:hypothetical protein